MIGKRKGRYVYETNTRGRGNGGRYHNPGRGGGRGGRFGRDCGSGGGKGHGHDMPQHINGVNTSNIWKSFTDKEWDMIGPEGRRMISNAIPRMVGLVDGDAMSQL